MNELEINVSIESEEQTINLIRENTEQKIVIASENIKITENNDYKKLENKPKINDIELVDNKTLDDLNIQIKGDYANTRITNLEIDNLFN